MARFALRGQAEQPPRRAARVYGRRLELAILRHMVGRLAGGRGGVCVLIGELGMGKSHLLAALRDSSDVSWADAAAASYGQPRSGAMIAAALHELLGLTGADDPAARLGEALADLLGARAGAAARPYLARFLGLPLDEAASRELAALAGESLRWRIFELLEQLLRASCARQPLVLALDDLQWADPTSLELLESLPPLAEELPLLLILAGRPGDWVAGGRWPVAGGRWPAARHMPAGALRIELGRLGEEAALAVVAQHAPELGETARARLAARGQGNPLFLVELARTAAAGGDPDELPDSVQGLLLAQIDRLPGELRETLQLAAVLGPGFAPRLLAALVGPGSPLDAQLEALATAGFLLSGGEGYSFRHALIRESAYGALLYERRRGHHGAAAAAIERLYPTRLAERAGELAEHYERAENLGQAARYHGQAADGARLLYANDEAEAGYRRVLELLGRGPAGDGLRARTYLKLAQVKMNAGEYAAAQALYDVAFGLLEPKEHSGSGRGTRRTPAFHMRIDPPETLDPGLCEASASEEVIANLFEGLVDLDDDFNVMPAAARRWQIEDGGRRYIFELRPDLRWADGAPLTAHDFVFAWRRNLHPSTCAGMAQLLYIVRGARDYHQGLADGADSVSLRALDDHTLSIDLDSQCGYFLHLLTRPVTFPQPAHIVGPHGPAWAHADRIVGNGAFQLRRRATHADLELIRNPYYLRPSGGNLESIHLFVRSNGPDRDDSGALDWVGSDRSIILDDQGGAVIVMQQLMTFFLAFATGAEPFSSPQIRRAFAQSIDRQELVATVTAGVQRAATGGIVPPGMVGHSVDMGLDFDPEHARLLLEPAGRQEMAGLRLAALRGSRTPHYLAESWQRHLGVSVEVVEDLSVEEIVAGLQRGTFHMALLAWGAEYPDPDSLLRVLFHSASPFNCFGWSHALFDQLVERAAAIAQPQERLRLYHAADRLLVAEQAVILPLFYYQNFGLLRSHFTLPDSKTFIRGSRLRLDRILATK